MYVAYPDISLVAAMRSPFLFWRAP